MYTYTNSKWTKIKFIQLDSLNSNSQKSGADSGHQRKNKLSITTNKHLRLKTATKYFFDAVHLS